MKNVRLLRYRIRNYSKLYNSAIALHNFYCNLTGFMHVKPDFYIIGAAKCGTSSLYDHLIRHPEIHSAVGKELHYFEELFSRGNNWYKACFPFKTKKFFEQSILKKKFLTGEATPRYIDNPHVPKRIKEFTPNAKFIVMLRNPIDRAYSHYSMITHGKSAFLENLSFEEAILKENERINEEVNKIEKDPNYQSEDYYTFGYLERGYYAKKLKFWFNLFPKNKFHIVQSEEFFKNPDFIYNQVLDFLDVDKFHLLNYKKIKSGKYGSKLNPKTRDYLSNYFSNYNEELYDLIGKKFNWD